MKKSILLALMSLGLCQWTFAANEINVATAGPAGLAEFEKQRKTIETECDCKVNFRTMEAPVGLKGITNNTIDAIVIPNPEAFYKQKILDFSAIGFENLEWQFFFSGPMFLLFNAENPIGQLTDQQVTDLLNKKVTNWKQISGLDANTNMHKAKNLIGVNVAASQYYLNDAPMPVNEVINFDGLVRAIKADKGAAGIAPTPAKDDPQVKSIKINATLNLQMGFPKNSKEAVKRFKAAMGKHLVKS